MALQFVFNPLSGKFDYISTVDTSAFAPAVPQLVSSTFSVSTNTQICYATPIITTGSGIVVTVGTAALIYVN